MKITKAELETVCGITSKLPENLLPEFAFAGKSNVGKSSLINALMQRKSFARVSEKPGKTQTINFYRINRGVTAEEENERGFAPDCYLVDLPGYGYAKAGAAVSAKWGKMVERYLHGSKQLKNVFLLIDIRHEPSANDKQMYEWILAQGYTPLVIATKADKIKRSQLDKQKKIVREGLGMPKGGTLIAFSAETKQGRDEIYELLMPGSGEETP